MKNLKLITIVTIFAFISANSYGGDGYQKWRSDRQQRCVKSATQSDTRIKAVTQGRDVTGAPIDGGLLTLLAAGGIAIYGAKKKKKKSLEN